MNNKISVFYCEAMSKTNKSFSPSSNKPAQVVQDWNQYFAAHLSIEPVNPVDKVFFKQVHDKDYVEAIFNGTAKNGFGLKDSDFASTFPYTVGSLYDACKQALVSGVAVSPTSGFHHAHFDKAKGFCTFNGLVISAHLLQEQFGLNHIGILDCDMHYGDGTQDLIDIHHIPYIEHYSAGEFYDLHYPALEFFKPLLKAIYNPLFNSSKSENTPIPKLRQKILKGKGDDFLKKLPDILNRFKHCDILIYQAGADQHVNDPYGGLLTYEQMIVRDKMVFEFCKINKIPVAWNLAGGYQRNKNGIEPVILCHHNTMKTCLEVFQSVK